MICELATVQYYLAMWVGSSFGNSRTKQVNEAHTSVVFIIVIIVVIVVIVVIFIIISPPALGSRPAFVNELVDDFTTSKFFKDFETVIASHSDCYHRVGINTDKHAILIITWGTGPIFIAAPIRACFPIEVWTPRPKIRLAFAPVHEEVVGMILMGFVHRLPRHELKLV